MTDEELQRERFPRRTQRRQETRAKILKAAGRLFRKVGYGAATMNAIADSADVHVTTLFTHFKNKRDLAVSLNDAAVEILEKLVADAKGQMPFFEFFLDLVLRSASRIEHVNDPAQSLWSAMGQDPELTSAWVQYEQRQIVLLSDYVAHDYGLDRDADPRPELIANLMLASSRISHRRWTNSAPGLDLQAETRDVVELATTMARAVLAG